MFALQISNFLRPIAIYSFIYQLLTPITHVNDNVSDQLYDMNKDESETTNLYNKYPEVVKELKELLEKQKNQGFSVHAAAQKSS